MEGNRVIKFNAVKLITKSFNWMTQTFSAIKLDQSNHWCLETINQKKLRKEIVLLKKINELISRQQMAAPQLIVQCVMREGVTDNASAEFYESFF